jgi:hypothetical protein
MPRLTPEEHTMPAYCSSFPTPVYSAGDLCKAMLAGAGTDEPVPASGLDRILRHDPERGVLEVQAGVRWGALASVLGAEYSHGSVGESVARNSAGPDGRPIVAHVRALTLACADGELRRASRERTPDLFRLAVGGFGAFGAFYSLTLETGSLVRALAAPAGTVHAETLPDAQDAPRHRVELLLPPQTFRTTLDKARAACEARRCRLAVLEARQVLPEAETYLCWARRDYIALRIEFQARPTIGASVGAAQLRARLMALATEAGGSFTADALPFASRAQAEACYPMLGGFLEEKRRLDPAGRMLTPWYRAVRRAWRGDSCKVRWASA